MKKTIALCCLICFLSCLLTCLFWILLQRPTLSIIQTWKQPKDITYNSFDPYFLHIVEDNYDFGHVPFTLPRNYFIYVGREEDKVTYGHVKNYSFEYNQDIKKYFELCKVNWTLEGVFFTEPSGHKLFIPKASFIGGR